MGNKKDDKSDVRELIELLEMFEKTEQVVEKVGPGKVFGAIVLIVIACILFGALLAGALH